MGGLAAGSILTSTLCGGLPLPAPYAELEPTGLPLPALPRYPAGYRQYSADAVPLTACCAVWRSPLVGAGLGLVGVLFQQVLRNAAGGANHAGRRYRAQLGITITTLPGHCPAR